MMSSMILAAALLAPTAGPKIPYGLGCIDMTTSERTFLKSKGIDYASFAKGIKDTLPPQYQLKWAPRPHPSGQGMRGTCVGWALSYAAKSCLEGREAEHAPDSPEAFFSPSFIYSQRPNKPQDGMNLGQAIYIMYLRGCVPYARMPYLEATADDPPGVQDQSQAFAYQIADWMVIEPPSVDKIKTVLTRELPVVIGVNVTPEFAQIEGDAVFSSFDPANILGGHAMCVVGYDDQRRALRLLNSWGLDWADHGYCWVSYDLFDSTAEMDKRFFKVGAALFDAPNVATKVTLNDEGAGKYTWTIGILGSPKALGEIEAVDYLLPAGYEPAVFRSTASDGNQAFVLRSSDLQPNATTSSVEIWAQICLKGTSRKMAPRPVLVQCGKPREPGSEPGRAAVPPAWIGGGSSGPGGASPAPAASSSAETVIVPKLTGMNSTMAILKLKSLGLEVKVRHQQSGTSGNRAGAVLEQSQAAGTKVQRGSEIIVTVP